MPISTRQSEDQLFLSVRLSLILLRSISPHLPAQIEATETEQCTPEYADESSHLRWPSESATAGEKTAGMTCRSIQLDRDIDDVQFVDAPIAQQEPDVIQVQQSDSIPMKQFADKISKGQQILDIC